MEMQERKLLQNVAMPKITLHVGNEDLKEVDDYVHKGQVNMRHNL